MPPDPPQQQPVLSRNPSCSALLPPLPVCHQWESASAEIIHTSPPEDHVCPHPDHLFLCLGHSCRKNTSLLLQNPLFVSFSHPPKGSSVGLLFYSCFHHLLCPFAIVSSRQKAESRPRASGSRLPPWHTRGFSQHSLCSGLQVRDSLFQHFPKRLRVWFAIRFESSSFVLKKKHQKNNAQQNQTNKNTIISQDTEIPSFYPSFSPVVSGLIQSLVGLLQETLVSWSVFLPNRPFFIIFVCVLVSLDDGVICHLGRLPPSELLYGFFSH